MNKQTFRGIISLIIFILGVAVTLPLATGVFIDRLVPQLPEDGYGEESEDEPFTVPPIPTDPPETTAEPDTEPQESSSDQTLPGDVTSGPDDITTSPEETTAEAETSEATTEPPPPVTSPETTPLTRPVYYGSDFGWIKVDKSFFNDALFIGDSRTVGIRNASAGRLEGAVFFCDIGTSASKAMSNSCEVTYGADVNGKRKSLGKMTLSQLLDSMHFGKVYIMVGVNELGGSIGGIAGNIEKLKNMVMTLCPDCKIFLEGNLHFTTAAEANYRAQKKTYMTNDRINQVNARMAAMADWKTVFYFDINEHFDIDGGSFNPAFSGDGVHPTSTYYREWADWIYTRGILD